MSANRYLVDAGGTTRHIKKRYVVDSSGTSRLIKKRYVIDSGGSARLTFLYGFSFTLTAGNTVFATGFQTVQSPFYGSMSPSNVMPDGRTIGYLITGNINSTPNSAGLFLYGFPSDPGKSFLTSVQINGLNLTGSGASNYSYTTQSGVLGALWQWLGGISPLTSGGSYPGIITTNG